jgi:hypothetical protein
MNVGFVNPCLKPRDCFGLPAVTCNGDGNRPSPLYRRKAALSPSGGMLRFARAAALTYIRAMNRKPQ